MLTTTGLVYAQADGNTSPWDPLKLCEPGCDELHQFCGIDGTCHDYNCPEWFQYGPQDSTVGRNLTDYDDDRQEEFEFSCRDLSEEQPDTSFYSIAPECEFGWAPWAIVIHNATYGESEQPTSWCPYSNTKGILAPGQVAALAFNRKCTAIMPYRGQSHGLGFVCYDFKDHSMALNRFQAQLEDIMIMGAGKDEFSALPFVFKYRQRMRGWYLSVRGIPTIFDYDHSTFDEDASLDDTHMNGTANI